ncbi:MAG TPA: 50S ribosome-binding GTPase, partial [Spirochaetota bacterium]|nr:50S ribosome-binding GTPase [Spirochaetota bacterium]
MQTTPRGERIQIGIFGNRNAGKSSLINALAGQSLAIVSEKPGTTTDPVSKAMELLPLGPVTLVDTAGLDDDEPGLGGVRVQRSLDELPKSDLVLAVLDA